MKNIGIEELSFRLATENFHRFLLQSPEAQKFNQ